MCERERDPPKNVRTIRSLIEKSTILSFPVGGSSSSSPWNPTLRSPPPSLPRLPMQDLQRASTSSPSSSSPQMSRDSLSPEISPFSSSSPSSRVIYSDRFIPSRKGSNFALFDLCPPPPKPALSSSAISGEGRSGGREDSSGAYSSLLRSVLFGSPDTPERVMSGRGSLLGSPTSGDSSSINSSPSPLGRNIFRFKSEVRRVNLFPDVQDGGLSSAIVTPPKALRKVSRSPYKVCLIE